ncbi:MAG: hypothetical protein GY851_36515 [bacterium]|nr:hypothetical protein [bacterium]
MSRRKCAFVTLLLWIVGVTLAGCAHTPPVPLEPAPAPADDTTVSRIRIAPDADDGQGSLRLRVSHPEQCAPADTVAFHCTIHSEKIYTNLLLCLDVKDESGCVCHAARQVIDVAEGSTPAQFAWQPADLADGVHVIEFRVEQEPVRTLATRTLTLTQTTLANVSDLLDRCETALAVLRETLSTYEGQECNPAYARLRLTVVERTLPVAKKALARDDWERAAHLGRYVDGAIRAARAELALASLTPELTQPSPSRDLKKIEAHGGVFQSGDRPVFLFGGIGDSTPGQQLPLFSRLGLNAASVGPARSLADGERAASADIVLFTGLGLESLDAAALEKRPSLALGNRYDISRAGAVDAARERIEEAAGSLKEGQGAVIVSLADRPAFTLDGERFRAGFIGSLEERYGDRRDMNHIWQSRYRNFAEVPVDWSKTDRAYQSDLIAYQNTLVTRFFSETARAARESIPGALIAIRLPGDLTIPGTGRADMDHEDVMRSVDVVEFGPPAFVAEPGLALGYPGAAFQSTLLTSIAPDRPVVGALASLPVSPAQDGSLGGRAVHTAVWESVMAGADGVLVPMATGKAAAGSLLRDPYGLEGFGRAALDVNRLGETVAAFQQASAEIAILWSESSRTFDGGTDYLASVRTAFEGVLWFGAKVRFVTEHQCAEGALKDVRLLVMPSAPAVSNAAFDKIQAHVTSGGYVVRTSLGMPYDPRGLSRPDVLKHTTRTYLVGGSETPLDYLRAVDMANTAGALTRLPRAVNRHGYPIEGLVTRYVEVEGVPYLYLCNLGEVPVTAHVQGDLETGRDLIGARPVQFPTVLDPLDPMLIRFEGKSEPSSDDG